MPLADDDLIALLRKEEEAASGYQDAALSAVREEALAYYDRQPYGDEQEGASSIVTSEFADVVESLMPGLMRVFTGSDDLAKFAPMAPGQEKWAKEASEYVPHVLMRQNDGFRIISALLKDALMYRLSGATVDLEDVEDKRSVPVQNLTQDAIDLIVAEAQAQGAELVMELTPDPLPRRRLASDGVPPTCRRTRSRGTFSGTITVTHKRKRVVVDSIAPEDIRFSPAARDEDKASYLGFIKRVTSSDLVKLGLTQEEIDDLSADKGLSDEAAQRNEGVLDDAERSGTLSNGEGDSERPLWLVVAYIRADDDGDGISELLRVVYAHGGGTAGRIIERVEWSGPASIALATPILMPHTIVGRSLFDQTQDLQQLGSVLTRGLLDNLYIVNRPRPVISDQVNLDSLIDWVPGSPIRLKPGARPGDNHVAWLQVPNVTGAVLSALEHLATVRENRTGVSRYNQGLDAESLNKTLGGLDRIMSAASQRQDLIARTFAGDRDQAALSPDLSRHQARGDRTGCLLAANGRRLRKLRSQPMARRHGVVGRRRGHRQSRAGDRPSRPGRQPAGEADRLSGRQGGRPVRDGREHRQRCAEARGDPGLQDAGPLLPAGRQGDEHRRAGAAATAAGAEPRAARGPGADRDPAPSGGGRHADQAREGAGRHRHRRVQGAAMGGNRALQGRSEGEPSGRCRARPRDAVMTDDNEQRYRRAREVLADAGWLFDDFVNNEMRRVLTSDPDDMTTREIAYNRARVATEVKAALSSLVDEYEADIQLKERREQLKESLYGRRN